MKNMLVLLGCAGLLSCNQPMRQMDLSGKWDFTADTAQWSQTINLPGSVTSNNLGEDISLETPWTGTIIDSSFFYMEKYAEYREPGNFKVPFWLQPVKYFRGEGWYRKTVDIPADWDGSDIVLTLERCHWDTELWVDGNYAGSGHSLGVPHRYVLTEWMTPGRHELLLKVDNSLKTVNPGVNSHSVSDHTQGNWNGVVGDLMLEAVSKVRVDHVAVFPDVEGKKVRVEVEVLNTTGEQPTVELLMETDGKQVGQTHRLTAGINRIAADIELGDSVRLWDEFHPDLYSLEVCLNGADGKELDRRSEQFGMRELKVKDGHVLLNGKRVFFRGMLDCAAYPITGYPPMEREAWAKLYDNCRKHGLNHVRFHSWCPPEIAFEVADEMGFYLQVECSSWANQGVTIGDGAPLDRFVMEESERMVREYGNHPSFCMLLYGNEPAGEGSNKYLENFVTHWKEKDGRRLYSTSGGWPNLPVNDFLNDPAPRIQGWAQELASVINAEAPRTDYDWADYIHSYNQPIISHEIGQWCVYPDFKEIDKYTGVMRACNFEIFRDELKRNGMIHLADSFLLASGKLQALCYKADVEAALRTPDFAGFQLLGLYDFPGQGTALVGVLNVFGEEKGYITPEEYRRFCNSTVPLVRLPKLVYTNGEVLTASAEVAHFGAAELKSPAAGWKLLSSAGEVLGEGTWQVDLVPIGNQIALGELKVPLDGIKCPEQLCLKVYVGDFENDWNVWVYPAQNPETEAMKDILMADRLDARACEVLDKGGSVLLSIPKGKLRAEMGGDIKIGFSSIFWNTAWTIGQAPHTLGILCNPQHPALAGFPTEYHSDYQWWDAMSHSGAIELAKLHEDAVPVVRVIDDWFTNRPLALLTEFKVGNGKVLVSGIDFWKDMDKRPEARQLLYSLKSYMAGSHFNPAVEVSPQTLQKLY